MASVQSQLECLGLLVLGLCGAKYPRNINEMKVAVNIIIEGFCLEALYQTFLKTWFEER